MNPQTSWIAFADARRVASGQPRKVATMVKQYVDRNPLTTLLIFDLISSELVELDLRGTLSEVIERLPKPVAEKMPASKGTGKPGRPKLGVIPREVTLLPRHWDWLASQPGGASATLRKLVEHALRANKNTDRQRRARDAAYRFMSSMAGNAPNFEDATRALFANDLQQMYALTTEWPNDVREHALALAASAVDQPSA